MPGLQPPGVPVFYPGLDTVSQFNTGIFNNGVTAGIRDTLTFMNHKPQFRARRVASQTVTEGGHTKMIWDTIDVDNYGGGVVNDQNYTCQAPGWYLATARVSLNTANAGATGLAVIPALAVNGASPTGFGTSGWEGTESPVPVTAGAPKCVNATWIFYISVGDLVSLDLFYSTESTITTTGTTTGFEPMISLVWSSR